jgi:hypothetical protein
LQHIYTPTGRAQALRNLLCCFFKLDHAGATPRSLLCCVAKMSGIPFLTGPLDIAGVTPRNLLCRVAKMSGIPFLTGP